jgi:phage tail protein X
MSDPVKYRTHEGDMVDEIANAYYGKTDGTTELLLDANPGLANYDVLPAGIVITLPPMPTPTVASTVQLWT